MEDLVLKLFSRFREEGVEYVLVGGQAVRLNGFLRATEAIDVLVRPTRENGHKVKQALDFLQSSGELDPDSTSTACCAPRPTIGRRTCSTSRC